MKIRNGFVSNSSSSSFAILGVKLTQEEKEKLWNDDEYEFNLIDGLEGVNDIDSKDEPAYVGVIETRYQEYGIQEAFKKKDFEIVENLLREQFGPDRELDIAVFYGMRYS